MAIVLQIAILLLLGFVFLLFFLKLKEALVRLYITVQGPFFGATSNERIDDLLAMIAIKPGDVVVDLGSGDGRVLIAIARKYNVRAVGYEIDPKLVKLSRKAVIKAGLEDKITIYDRSFWDADISEFDVVVIYCVPRFLRRIENKFARELKSTAQVFSIFFRFPTWKPVKQIGDILMYRKNP